MLGVTWVVVEPGVGFATRWFLRVKVRLGREADRRGGGTGDVACDVYPPRLVTVVRDRCSAGGWVSDCVGLVGHRGVVGLDPCDCSGLWMRWWSYHCGSL